MSSRRPGMPVEPVLSLLRCPLQEGDDAELAVRAVLPAGVAQLTGELTNLSPVALGEEHVPFEIDVTFYCEAAEAEPAILLGKRALKIVSNLFRDVGKGEGLHLTAQAPELAVRRVALIADPDCALFDRGIDRERVVLVRQPGEAISHVQLVDALRTSNIRGTASIGRIAAAMVRMKSSARRRFR